MAFLSPSPNRSRPSSPRLKPHYKFTILSPDIYAPKTIGYSPPDDPSYGFCRFLKGKFESHFSMRCSLPTKPGSAFIGDFDEFEELFLVDSEYVVIVVTEKAVLALKKFYPRLLVFVTVRPEWVNRFIILFVGDVALDPIVDLNVLFHQPITFKKSQWEADLETWKKLHILLQVEWKPHKEEEPPPKPRCGEVVSIVQRTVVETEVQEVRTRRRTGSRGSDNASTPGTPSPVVQRRVITPSGANGASTEPDEAMYQGRRRFGSRNSAADQENVEERQKAEEPPEAVIQPQSKRETQSVPEVARVRPRVKIEREFEDVSFEPQAETVKDTGAAHVTPTVKPEKETKETSARPRIKIERDFEDVSFDPQAAVIEKEATAKATLRPQVKIEREVKPVRNVEASLSKDLSPATSPSLSRKNLTNSSEKSDTQVFVNLTSKTAVPFKDITLSASSSLWDAGATSGYSSLDSSMSVRSSTAQSPPIVKEMARPNEGSKQTKGDEEEEKGLFSSVHPLKTDVSLAPAVFAQDEAISILPSSETIVRETGQVVEAQQVIPTNIGKTLRLPSPDGDVEEEERKEASGLVKTVKAVPAMVARFLWRPMPRDSDGPGFLHRPIPVALIMVTATALSPLYRRFSLALFNAITGFFWPPILAMDTTDNVLVAVAPSKTVPNLLAASPVSMQGSIPNQPSLLSGSSRVEISQPDRFVLWVSPSKK